MEIATIINYCSNERRFLQWALEGVKAFSICTYVVVCDHFFDGKKEDVSNIKQAAHQFPYANFFLYPYEKRIMRTKQYKRIGQANFWHSFSRLIGCSYLPSSVEYVLFLDVDEIVNSELFIDWLKTKDYLQYDVMKLANYWYFLLPHFRAKQTEDSVVLIKKDKITKNNLLHKEERNALYDNVEGKKIRRVKDKNGQPMIHHYSWVRTKEEMIKKVSSWGHKHDKDWKRLIEDSLASQELKKDFVHGYDLERVSPHIILNERQDDKRYKELSLPANFTQISPDDTYSLVSKPNFFSQIFSKFFAKNKIFEEKERSF